MGRSSGWTSWVGRAVWLVACMAAVRPVHAQSAHGNLDTQPWSAALGGLDEQGLQDLAWVEQSDSLVVGFEYRLARSPLRGVCGLLAALPDARHVTAVLRYAGLPMVAVSLDSPASATEGSTESAGCAGSRIATGSYDVRPYREGVRLVDSDDAPMLDVVVGPQYGIRWGSRWDVIEAHVALAPRVDVRLWKGMELTAQMLFPVWNELPGETGYIRPGRVMVSQLARIARGTFLRLAAGKFTAGRLGVDAQAKTILFGGRLALGFEAGRTTSVTFPNGSLYVEPAPRTTLLANATAYVPMYDLFVQVAGGQFLFGDAGVSGTLTRQFGGVDVALTAVKTDIGRNVGFGIVLPLLRGRAWGHRQVRVRPEPFLPVRYEYSRDALVGETYDTGTDLDHLFEQYHPLVLRRRLRSR